MSSISRKGNNRPLSGTVDRRLASGKTKVHHAADAGPELLVKNGLYQGEAETGACKGANQSPIRNALHHPLKNTKLCFEDRLARCGLQLGSLFPGVGCSHRVAACASS